MAPASASICKECTKRGAENLDVALFWMFEMDVVNSLNNGGSAASDWARHHLKSYHDGKYIRLPELVQLYREREPELIRELNSLHNNE